MFTVIFTSTNSDKQTDSQRQSTLTVWTRNIIVVMFITLYPNYITITIFMLVSENVLKFANTKLLCLLE